MPAVYLRGIARWYGEVRAVDSVTLTVPDRALLTLLGPSGCGKSTLLRLVAGLDRPTAGEIAIGDEVVSSAERGIFVPPERRRVGMVFQSYAVWPHMDVFANVAYPLRVARLPRAEIAARTERALALVRLEALARRYPAELSGGQQQRVALARAIVAEPRLLLLDEPLSNLDAKLREELREELRELQRRLRLTTIFVTHDQTEALALSDVVVVMRAGQVLQVGSPRAVYDEPADRFVAAFVGQTNFIPGRLVAVEPGLAETPFGPLPCRPAAGLRAGDPVTLSVRPEHLGLDRHPGASAPAGSARPEPAPGLGRGRVEAATFTGDRVSVVVRLGEAALRAEAHPLDAPEVGDTVEVRLIRPAAMAFPADAPVPA